MNIFNIDSEKRNVTNLSTRLRVNKRMDYETLTLNNKRRIKRKRKIYYPG